MGLWIWCQEDTSGQGTGALEPAPAAPRSVWPWQTLSISGPLTPHLQNSREGGFPSVRQSRSMWDAPLGRWDPGPLMSSPSSWQGGAPLFPGPSPPPPPSPRQLPSCLSNLLASSAKALVPVHLPELLAYPHTVGPLRGRTDSQRGVWNLRPGSRFTRTCLCGPGLLEVRVHPGVAGGGPHMKHLLCSPPPPPRPSSPTRSPSAAPATLGFCPRLRPSHRKTMIAPHSGLPSNRSHSEAFPVHPPPRQPPPTGPSGCSLFRALTEASPSPAGPSLHWTSTCMGPAQVCLGPSCLPRPSTVPGTQ